MAAKKSKINQVLKVSFDFFKILVGCRGQGQLRDQRNDWSHFSGSGFSPRHSTKRRHLSDQSNEIILKERMSNKNAQSEK